MAHMNLLIYLKMFFLLHVCTCSYVALYVMFSDSRLLISRDPSIHKKLDDFPDVLPPGKPASIYDL